MRGRDWRGGGGHKIHSGVGLRRAVGVFFSEDVYELFEVNESEKDMNLQLLIASLDKMDEGFVVHFTTLDGSLLPCLPDLTGNTENCIIYTPTKNLD